MVHIIEIFGVPCSGKSTLAAEILAEAKKVGLNVEHCGEVFKAWDYTNNPRLEDQMACIASQYLENTKFGDAVKNLDILIVEAPLLQSCCWGKTPTELFHLCRKLLHSDNHIHVAAVLNKPFEYNSMGRKQHIPKNLGHKIFDLVIRNYPRYVTGPYEPVKQGLFNLIHQLAEIKEERNVRS